MKKVLWAVIVVGVLLMAAPLVMQLPSRGNAGQTMIDDFRPIMQADSVNTTVDYYDNVFVPLRAVVPAVSTGNLTTFGGYLQGMTAMESETQRLVPGLAQAMHTTPDQVQQFLGSQFPATAQLLQGLPRLQSDFASLLGVMSTNAAIFAKVPAGLDHYRPLISAMKNNVDNYRQIDSLPSFRLFTWFFIIPGAVLVLLGGLGLLQARRVAPAVAVPAPA